METETKEETKDEKANWVINLFVKRKWAEQLPAVKPIPGFCEFIWYFSLNETKIRLKNNF